MNFSSSLKYYPKSFGLLLVLSVRYSYSISNFEFYLCLQWGSCPSLFSQLSPLWSQYLYELRDLEVASLGFQYPLQCYDHYSRASIRFHTFQLLSFQYLTPNGLFFPLTQCSIGLSHLHIHLYCPRSHVLKLPESCP